MNLPELLLLQTGEEGSEIAQIASKILRFGIDEVNCLEPDGPTNRERLVGELNDMMAMTRLLVEHGIIPKDWANDSDQKAKVRKVVKFANYSHEIGSLSGERVALPAWAAPTAPADGRSMRSTKSLEQFDAAKMPETPTP